MFGGYCAYTALFTYHSMTHDYYQVPLVVVTTVGLAAFGCVLEDGVSTWGIPKLRGYALAAVLLLSCFVLVRPALGPILRGTPLFVDNRERFDRIGRLIDPGTRIVTLSEEYGSPLRYHQWLPGTHWPSEGDRRAARLNRADLGSDYERFQGLLQQGTEYFVITDLEEFSRQPGLAEILKNYRVLGQTDEYLIYDLRSTDP